MDEKLDELMRNGWSYPKPNTVSIRDADSSSGKTYELVVYNGKVTLKEKG